MAQIKITGELQSRSGTSNKGKPYTIHSQTATVETAGLRCPIDVEVKNPNQPYAVGATHQWDPEADLRIGRYGLELSRHMTLVPMAATKAAPLRTAAG